MYKNFFKRFFDLILSFLAIIVLSPILLILTIIGFFAMKGNPFFYQIRPGKNGKLFKLYKFRTMSNEKDEKGNFLPDEMRLNTYGKFLRSTSLDELPELLNIFIGNMAIVGPRPLLVEYLPYYTEDEKHRHDVRPGLTGLSQVNGRNFLKWDERLKMDVEYVKNIKLITDIKIIFKTIFKVIKHDDISIDSSNVETNLAKERRGEYK